MALGAATPLSAAGTSPVNEERQKTVFKTILAELLERFRRDVGPEAGPAYVGAAAHPILEHTTRRHFIDRMLAALGWNLADLDREIIEEARVGEVRTLFLDYLGVEPELRNPLVIVEAKAWGKPFVSISSRAAQQFDRTLVTPRPASLVAAAVGHCKAGGSPETSPVIQEWAEWIAKVDQYVRAVRLRSGHCVRRVVLTSGEWMVVFTDPAKTFLDPEMVSDAGIIALPCDALVRHSDELFDLLARTRLADRPPELLNPRQVPAYVRADAVSKLFRAVWVSHRRAGAHFDAYPRLDVYAAAVLERDDGCLVTVVPGRPERLSLPADRERVVRHLSEIDEASDDLLADLRSEIGELPQPSPVQEFGGFPQPRRPTAALGRERRLVKSYTGGGEFLIVTGSRSHFLLPKPTIDPCSGHSWNECFIQGEHRGDAPILFSAHDPPSFFVSGEIYHCAHQAVHDRRDHFCHLASFEQFLCCRACVLQEICWSRGEDRLLPCGRLPTAIAS